MTGVSATVDEEEFKNLADIFASAKKLLDDDRISVAKIIACREEQTEQCFSNLHFDKGTCRETPCSPDMFCKLFIDDCSMTFDIAFEDLDDIIKLFAIAMKALNKKEESNIAVS